MRLFSLLRGARFGSLLREARLAMRLLGDPRVPLIAKAAGGAALLYVLFPLDVLPDFIPLAGQIDDLAVILFGIEALIRLTPPHLVDEHRAALARKVSTGRRFGL